MFTNSLAKQEIKAAQEFIELAKTDKEESIKLLDYDPRQITKLFKSSEVIELAKTNYDTAKKLLYWLSYLGEVCSVFNSTEKVIELAKACPNDAFHLINGDGLKFEPGLFTSAEQIIELAKIDGPSAYLIIECKNDCLFKSAEQVIELAKAHGGADILITYFPEKIASLFTSAEQVIELAKADRNAAGKLIQKCSHKIGTLFTSVNQALDFIVAYVSDNKSADKLAFEFPEIIAPLFSSAGQVLPQLHELVPTLFNVATTAEQKKKDHSNVSQSAPETNHVSPVGRNLSI